MAYCKVLQQSFQKKILTNLKNIRQTKVQRIHLWRKKRKAWNRGKQTQMPVTGTEGLAATDNG